MNKARVLSRGQCANMTAAQIADYLHAECRSARDAADMADLFLEKGSIDVGRLLGVLRQLCKLYQIVVKGKVV